MVEVKVPWPMRAVSETYSRTQDVLPKTFLSQQMKQNVFITSKNSKCELPDELSNDVRQKKISELHGIKV